MKEKKLADLVQDLLDRARKLRLVPGTRELTRQSKEADLLERCARELAQFMGRKIDWEDLTLLSKKPYVPDPPELAEWSGKY